MLGKDRTSTSWNAARVSKLPVMHPLLLLRQQQRQSQQAQQVTPPPAWPIAPVAPAPSTGPSLLEGLALVALAGLAIYSVASVGAAIASRGDDELDELDELESGDHLANPSWNYKLLARGRVVYEGETGRPHLRPIEHLIMGKKFDAVKVDPTPSPKPIARLIEAANLASHRDKYGRNPKYNRTNHG